MRDKSSNRILEAINFKSEELKRFKSRKIKEMLNSYQLAVGEDQNKKYSRLYVDIAGDMAMMVLNPIKMAIEGAFQTAYGIIGMTASLFYLPVSKEPLVKSSIMFMAGFGELLLTAVAPVAMMYNMMTRIYATVTKSERLEKQEIVLNIEKSSVDGSAVDEGHEVEKNQTSTAKKDFLSQYIDGFTKVLNDIQSEALKDTNFKKYGELQGQEKKPLGDTWYKDTAMIVMEPIGLAITGAYKTITGLMGVLTSPAFYAAGQKDVASKSALKFAEGIGALLLATVAPLARIHNLMTRSFATVTETLSKEEVKRTGVSHEEMMSGDWSNGVERPKIFSSMATLNAAYKDKLVDVVQEGDLPNNEESLNTIHKG